MAVFWFGWGKKVKNAVSKKEFQDTINPLNTRITTLEQKKSLTTTVFYEIEANWNTGNKVKFVKTPSELESFGNHFIVVFFKVDDFRYSQVVYVPGFSFNYDLPFIGISGYLSSTYPNVNVGFMISYVRKSSVNGYEFTIQAVKSDTNLTLNTFKIYSIS